MGGGTSTPISRDHNPGATNNHIKHESVKEQTLPYLNDTPSIANENTNFRRREVSQITKDRFHRVLRLVRQESKTLNNFNAKTYNMRKKELASAVTETIQRERQQTELRRHVQLTVKTGKELEDDLDDGRNMLYSMIGYELSSDEEEEEEEEHDINHPLKTESMISDCFSTKNLSPRSNANSDSNSNIFNSNSYIFGSNSNSNINNSNDVSRCNSKSTDGGIADLESDRFRYRNVFDDVDATTQLSSQRSSQRSSEREEGGDCDDFDEMLMRVQSRESDDRCRDGVDIAVQDNADDISDSESDSDDYDPKTDDFRPSEIIEEDARHGGHDYIPRRSSLAHNQQLTERKKKEHKLHSIMRQESLEARQARAKLKLEKRKMKKLAESQKSNGESYSDKSRRKGRGSIDQGTFEAQKNVLKEYKAHDQLRRESVAGREAKQREALARRLEERRKELGLEEERAF